jgi:hypothetical protein
MSMSSKASIKAEVRQTEAQINWTEDCDIQRALGECTGRKLGGEFDLLNYILQN